jgi:DNA repair protein RadC
MLTTLSLLDRAALEAIELAGAPLDREPTEELHCSDVAVAQYLPTGTAPRERHLRHVLAAGHELLTRIAAEAVRGRSVIERPQVLKEYFQVHFAGAERESFVVAFLDAHHRVIACEEMFVGTASETRVYPREVVCRALHHNATSLACAHNHPSGQAEPSRPDEYLTATLKSALALIDVRLIDHIVVGAGITVSFAERGLL